MTGRRRKVDFSTMTYDYVAWKEEGVWSAHCPAIPGAYGIGPTPASAVADLKEALGLLVEYLKDLGEPVPRSGPVRTGELSL